MRHVWSLLAGLLVAPLTWFLLATGQYRAQATVDDWTLSGSFDTAQLVTPVIFLAVAGVLLGLLGTLRWSPLGPVVAGLLLLVPPVLMFVDPFAVHETLPAESRLLGQTLSWRAPVDDGTLLVIGALLFMSVFSARRWRRWPAPAEATAVAGAATTPAVVDAGVTPAPDGATTEATTGSTGTAEAPTAAVPRQATGEADAAADGGAATDDGTAGDGASDAPADTTSGGTTDGASATSGDTSSTS